MFIYCILLFFFLEKKNFENIYFFILFRIIKFDFLKFFNIEFWWLI